MRRSGREGGGGKRKRQEKEKTGEEGEEGRSLGGLPWVQFGTIMGKRSWVCQVAGSRVCAFMDHQKTHHWQVP